MNPCDNSYRCKIFYRGCCWDSSERLYQALKCTDKHLLEAIRTAPTIMDAILLGNTVKISERDSLRLLYLANYLKFQQNPELILYLEKCKYTFSNKIQNESMNSILGSLKKVF
jgi:predicted NAD-dependent protein-ADP-ribosyltransferase YbiA (DUF1768 family)